MSLGIKGLKKYYDELSGQQKELFPQELKESLENLNFSSDFEKNKASLAIYKAFFKIDHIQYKSFPGLEQFSKSKRTKVFALLNSAKLLDNDELISLEPTTTANAEKLDVGALLNYRDHSELYKALLELKAYLREDFLLNNGSVQIYVNMLSHQLENPCGALALFKEYSTILNSADVFSAKTQAQCLSLAKYWKVLFGVKANPECSSGIRPFEFAINPLWEEVKEKLTAEFLNSCISLCESISSSEADQRAAALKKLINTYSEESLKRVTSFYGTHYAVDTYPYFNSIVDEKLQAKIDDSQAAVSDEEAKLYYYMVGNLIYRNTPEATKSARYLLLIPKVLNANPRSLITAIICASNQAAMDIIFRYPEEFGKVECDLSADYLILMRLLIQHYLLCLLIQHCLLLLLAPL